MCSVIIVFSQANVTFSHTLVIMDVCFATTCAQAGATGVGPGAINLEEVVRWTFDRVTVSHTGWYAFYIGQASTNNTLVRT